MFFKQYHLGCLSHSSYLVGSNGEAAVIDPQRDVDLYIEQAELRGLKIKYVIETHLHADFVSGHLELAKRTGAQIAISWRSQVLFKHLALHQDDKLKVGDLELTVMETPGHTVDSICLLLRETSDASQSLKLFTGDTLFCGGVGRPDLSTGRGYSAQEMAEQLYDSLSTILRLDDSVEVYPAHGSGSLCGKHIEAELSSTIGEQRRWNYALQPMPKSIFVQLVTEDPAEIPGYFARAVELNRKGANSLCESPELVALSAVDANASIARGAVVVDLRAPGLYAQNHLRGSLNIGLGAQLASWTGTLVPATQPIILVASDKADIEDAAFRLSRIGFENIAGYVTADSWLPPHDGDWDTETSRQMNVDELFEQLATGSEIQVLDVRRASEFHSGHIPYAINIPLSELQDRRYELPEEKPTAIVCASGYRSAIALSVLKGAGVQGVINVVGGTRAWSAADYPLERSEQMATCS